MNVELPIRCIGFSHLLQPPLTLLLARRLRLDVEFSSLGPLSSQIARNMAFASVFLPTCAGLLVGLSAPQVARGGSLGALAWLLAVFWTWRLTREIAMGPLLPKSWHWTLSAIFCVQGPVLAALLLAANV
jgi:hypothetical protein